MPVYVINNQVAVVLKNHKHSTGAEDGSVLEKLTTMVDDETLEAYIRRVLFRSTVSEA